MEGFSSIGFLVALDAPIALLGASTHITIARHRRTAKNTPRAFSRACRRRARVARRRNARAQFERETMARDDYAPRSPRTRREDASDRRNARGAYDPGACSPWRVATSARARLACCSVIRFVTSVCDPSARARALDAGEKVARTRTRKRRAVAVAKRLLARRSRRGGRVGRLEHGGGVRGCSATDDDVDGSRAVFLRATRTRVR